MTPHTFAHVSSVSASSASYASISICTTGLFELDEAEVEDGEAKRTRPESSVNSVSRSYGSDLTAVLISSSSPAAGGGMELLRWMERGSFKKKAGILGCAAGAT